MRKRTLLPLIFLLTFALWLTPTPAAEEWVLHKTITKPGGTVSAVHFSVGGNQLVVGTHYNDTAYNVQVYDATTFAYLHGKDYRDSGQRARITAIASRKGWYEAAIAGAFSKVYLHNTKRNTTLKTFNTSNYVNDLAYSPDGKRLAAAGSNGEIHIFHTDHRNGTRRLPFTTREHNGLVNAVAWSPDGNILASGGLDGTVRLWSGGGSINYAVLRGHTGSVLNVAFSPDGRTLASGAGQPDISVRIWDVNTQRHLRTINVRRSVSHLAFHPSKEIIAVSSSFDFYNPTNGQRMPRLRDPHRLTMMAFHPNGEFMAVGTNSGGGEFKIYKLVTANRLDANKDGTVDISDLIAVARDYGKTGDLPTDVNNDNRVDVKDFIEVAEAVNPDFAAPAPSVAQEMPHLPFTAQEVQKWIADAKAQGIDADGIAMLERLLQVVLQQVNPPKETVLLANYPNPFNPETWIPYQLATPAEVTVSIHSADGALVRTLELGQLPAGVYQEKDRAAYWDGTNEQGESVASGVYFYTLTAGDFSATRKMLIRK